MATSIDTLRNAQNVGGNTLTALLRRAAARYPERPFLQFDEEIDTYGKVERESNRLAHGLATLGVKQGETVATMLDNNLHAVLALLAINKIGAIGVPLNTAYKLEFLQRPIVDSGATLVIVEAQYLERLTVLEESIPNVQTIIVRGAVRGEAGSLRAKNVLSLDTVCAEDDSTLADINRPADLSLLVYTSGTTGVSKGCMLSHNYLCNIAQCVRRAAAYTEDDVIATCLPLFHINAMANLIATLMVGAKIAIDERFSVSNYWASLEKSGATVATILGSIASLVAAAEDTATSRRCYGQLRAATGAPFDKELQRKWKERFGVKWTGVVGYGLTEACLITSIEALEVGPPGSCGRRNGDFDVRIVDDEDRELPLNTPGEIICRPLHAHTMFEGYWRHPEETLKTLGNLWFHTGDIGKFDDAGYFYFLGRKKEYLRRRGENISAFELEIAFQEHPDLRDVSVHAVASAFGEDDIKVVAVKKASADLTEEALCRWAIQRFPYFAVPSYIEFRTDLPRNPMGKVMKYQLEKEGITPQTWSREEAGIKVTRSA